MLPLSKVEKGHHSRLLVLGRVALEDLINKLVVLFGELEGDAGIVDGGISMLMEAISICELGRASTRRTTWRASLATLGLAVKERYWVREAIRAGRKAVRNTKGAIFDAIVTVRGRNGCCEVEIYNCSDDRCI